MENWTIWTDDPVFKVVKSSFGDRLVSAGRIEGRPAVKVAFPPGLSRQMVETLQTSGVTGAYQHQAEATRLGLAGQDLIVTTGTGSGKTACGIWPALQRCLDEPAARALIICPTKALAEDQARRIAALAQPLGLTTATYDGDTPKSQRPMIRKHAHIVLTNPDMLHLGVLPQHELWAGFLKGLRTVVIDEFHVYRGLFGAHMGGVVRRLLRLCAWYSSRPVVIGLSATLADPTRRFEEVVGVSPTVVDRDASLKSQRSILLVAPRHGEERDSSPNAEAALLTSQLVAKGLRVLTFCRSRVATELVLREARRLIGSTADIEGYRGGYTADERRNIERRLFESELGGLVATSAMELGVDVGGLDVVVMNGYPGTPSRFWQQAGRAGRAGRPGTAILLAHADALERMVVEDPTWANAVRSEVCGAAVTNRSAVRSQLLCAAYERPLAPEEPAAFGPVGEEASKELLEEEQLTAAAGRLYYPSHNAPHPAVNLRGCSGLPVALICKSKVLGQMESWRAISHAHEGAVYLHRGETYLVTKLDLASRTATLEPYGKEDYTMPVVQSLVQPVADLGELAPCVSFHALEITTATVAFRRLAMPGHKCIEEVELDLPRVTLTTVGVMVQFPLDSPMDGVHSVEHAMRASAPFLTGCGPNDIGSTWGLYEPSSGVPFVWIYDSDEGGNGVTEYLSRHLHDWVVTAETMMSTCRCDDVCPLCLLSPFCESGNEHLSRPEGLKLLRLVAQAVR